jgi:hypothetical protein
VMQKQYPTIPLHSYAEPNSALPDVLQLDPWGRRPALVVYLYQTSVGASGGGELPC